MKIIRKNKCLFCLLLIPYIYLLIICTVRTNKRALLTGDITPVDSLIEVDSDKIVEGSFNSIYVISFDYCTIFQNRLVSTSTINTTGTVSSAYDYMASSEVSLMSRLQHNSSVQASIITAYRTAMEMDSTVNIDYRLSGAIISYYTEKALSFKIGDKVIGVNGKYAFDDIEQFRIAFNERKENDVFNVIRDNVEIEIVLDSNHYRSFGFYPDYDIDYESATPSIKVNNTVVGGPSGGLLQTLEVFNRLVSEDYSLGKTISGTGTIELDGSVGGIGAVEQKIHTAYKRGVDVFFCPSVNYSDALKAYNTLKQKERMALVEVKTFSDAIAYLKNEM